MGEYPRGVTPSWQTAGAISNAPAIFGALTGPKSESIAGTESKPRCLPGLVPEKSVPRN
jgi:hypothetical protein